MLIRGERRNGSEPAKDDALRRLRDHLDDPLLARTPEGLSPTPRAAELAPLVARIVQDAGVCIAGAGYFDAATVQVQFAIGAPDRFNLPVFLPSLEHPGRIAHGIVVNLRTTDRDEAVRLIEARGIDLAIGWFDGTPPHPARSFAFEDRVVCLCRANHPLAGRGLRRRRVRAAQWPRRRAVPRNA